MYLVCASTVSFFLFTSNNISLRLVTKTQTGTTHQNQESSSHTDGENKEREFWEKPCAFTPESRLEAHRHLEEKKKTKERER